MIFLHVFSGITILRSLPFSFKAVTADRTTESPLPWYEVVACKGFSSFICLGEAPSPPIFVTVLYLFSVTLAVMATF